MAASDIVRGALQAPSALLSKIRHDLKTPLNQIIGYAKILMEDAESAGCQEAEDALRDLVASAEACVQVQERLLTRSTDEVHVGHFEELKDDQAARASSMMETLAGLRSQPAATEWASDLDRLHTAVTNLKTLAE